VRESRPIGIFGLCRREGPSCLVYGLPQERRNDHKPAYWASSVARFLVDSRSVVDSEFLWFSLVVKLKTRLNGTLNTPKRTRTLNLPVDQSRLPDRPESGG
jgi:hypothetical protein